MTGQPQYTFRGQEENPACPGCGAEMEKRETVEKPTEDIDVYVCDDCETEHVDKWSF